VRCLAGELNQAFLNLIVNAAHAIGDAVRDRPGSLGTIHISTHGDGDFAEIRIRDTGTGIPEHIRSKIFDPFFTTKPVGVGTGQGLAIVYSVIVEKHRGTLELISEVGKGTTFVIRLPFVPEQEG
ncbi:MAG: hybrid sensor histidine kinase/response regulator, partial [Planctomycetales bacterium]|nr:hybrid sensor histidine kinase/response regulator [Planctomycetales bacterium]